MSYYRGDNINTLNTDAGARKGPIISSYIKTGVKHYFSSEN